MNETAHIHNMNLCASLGNVTIIIWLLISHTPLFPFPFLGRGRPILQSFRKVTQSLNGHVQQ